MSQETAKKLTLELKNLQMDQNVLKSGHNPSIELDMDSNQLN